MPPSMNPYWPPLLDSLAESAAVYPPPPTLDVLAAEAVVTLPLSLSGCCAVCALMFHEADSLLRSTNARLQSLKTALAMFALLVSFS